MFPKAAAATVLLTACAATAPAADALFHFTITADPRDNHTEFRDTLDTINTLTLGPGVFHVSVGDIDQTIPDNRDEIDAAFGSDFLWYPIIGNHEEETAADMTWLRNEYHNGNGERTPLKTFTNQDGPAGTVETTYTWDYGYAHFIALNQYWDGTSDTGTDGDVVPALRAWLEADLAANTRPVVFVFGHEPAFPENRHVGDSLDGHPVNRDVFWNLLEDYDVNAYFCGHTHVYSTHQEPGGDVWQIDAGAAGNGSAETFVRVTLYDDQVKYATYTNDGGSWHLLESWYQPVPEPATLTAMVLGGLVVLRRRRKMR
jgi:hypothetical protein